MPKFSLYKLLSRSPPRAPLTLVLASISSAKEPLDTAATLAANIAINPLLTPSTTLARVV
jgi:hypothetical protein